MNINATKTVVYLTDISDNSKTILSFAVDYCKRSDFQLHLLHAIDHSIASTIEENNLEITERVKLANSKLKKLAEELDNNNEYNVTWSTCLGSITEAIKIVGKEMNVQKIIKTVNHSNNLFFESTSFMIVQETRIPVLSVCANTKIKEFKTILFPFSQISMTLEKADVVIDIAKMYKSKIILLGISEANTIEKQNIISNNMMYVKSLFDEEKILNEVHFVASDDYSEAIFDFVAINNIDLITIANNLPSTLIDHSNFIPSKKILNNTEVSVLTIPVNA